MDQYFFQAPSSNHLEDLLSRFTIGNEFKPEPPTYSDNLTEWDEFSKAFEKFIAEKAKDEKDKMEHLKEAMGRSLLYMSIEERFRRDRFNILWRYFNSLASEMKKMYNTSIRALLSPPLDKIGSDYMLFARDHLYRIIGTQIPNEELGRLLKGSVIKNFNSTTNEKWNRFANGINGNVIELYRFLIKHAPESEIIIPITDQVTYIAKATLMK